MFLSSSCSPGHVPSGQGQLASPAPRRLRAAGGKHLRGAPGAAPQVATAALSGGSHSRVPGQRRPHHPPNQTLGLRLAARCNVRCARARGSSSPPLLPKLYSFLLLFKTVIPLPPAPLAAQGLASSSARAENGRRRTPPLPSSPPPVCSWPHGFCPPRGCVGCPRPPPRSCPLAWPWPFLL